MASLGHLTGLIQGWLHTVEHPEFVAEAMEELTKRVDNSRPNYSPEDTLRTLVSKAERNVLLQTDPEPEAKEEHEQEEQPETLPEAEAPVTPKLEPEAQPKVTAAGFPIVKDPSARVEWTQEMKDHLMTRRGEGADWHTIGIELGGLEKLKVQAQHNNILIAKRSSKPEPGAPTARMAMINQVSRF